MEMNIECEWYDRGKFVVNLGCPHGHYLLVSSFSRIGGDWNSYFSQLQVSSGVKSK